MIHGPARHELTEQDWSWLEQLAQAGCRSCLGFSFYSLETWARILDLGYDDIVLRLWHDPNSLPRPAEYYGQYGDYVAYLSGMCHNHSATLAVAPLNEPNLELPDISPAELIPWLRDWLFLMRNHQPRIELLAPSIARSFPGAWGYLQTIRSVYDRFDALSVHFYWQSADDLNPGAGWSPEWWRGQFPTMQQRLTEVGGADGTSREWRYQTYYEMLSRYWALDYVKSQHVFVMSAEDDHWAQLGHTYDARIVEILGDVAALAKPEEVTVMPEEFRYILGFEGYAQAHPEIGKATSELFYDAHGDGYQFCEAGELVWNRQGAQVLFLADASPKA